MKKNIHTIDRMIRLLIAAIAIVLFFTNTISGTAGLVVLIVGIILGATALINFCPIYAALGISTNKKSAE